MSDNDVMIKKKNQTTATQQKTKPTKKTAAQEDGRRIFSGSRQVSNRNGQTRVDMQLHFVFRSCFLRTMTLYGFFVITYFLFSSLIAGSRGVVSSGREALVLPLQKRYGRRLVRDRRSLKSYPIVAENDGVWYSKIHIGTPPQVFTAIVDTGSGTIAVPCAGCACGNHNHFSTAQSSTAVVRSIQSVLWGRQLQ